MLSFGSFEGGCTCDHGLAIGPPMRRDVRRPNGWSTHVVAYRRQWIIRSAVRRALLHRVDALGLGDLIGASGSRERVPYAILCAG